MQSAFVSARLCHCISLLCGTLFFVALFSAFYYVGKLINRDFTRGVRERVLATVVAEQNYHFTKLTSALNLDGWSQRAKLKTFCNGTYEAHGDNFARLFNVVISESKASGPRGGEPIGTVLQRPESAEYYVLTNGFLTLACPTTLRTFENPFRPKSPFNARKKQPRKTIWTSFTERSRSATA